MAIYIGTSKMKDVYLGTSKVKEIYLGASKVYQSVISVIHLLTNGIVQTGYSFVFTRDNTAGGIEQRTGYWRLSGYNSGTYIYSYKNWYWTASELNLSGKNTVHVRSNVNVGAGQSDVGFYVEAMNGGTLLGRINITSRTIVEQTLDISQYAANITALRFHVIISGGGTSAAINAYDLWVE